MSPRKRVDALWRDMAPYLAGQPDDAEACLWVTPDGVTAYGPSKREALRRMLEEVAAAFRADPVDTNLEAIAAEVLEGSAVVLTGESWAVRLVASL